MKIRRTIPPAAAPIPIFGLVRGAVGLLHGGRALRDRQREIEEFFRVRHVFLVSSGKAALALILGALRQISPDRDEVLIPAYTCYSVPSAIVKAGLKIKLCDIDATTFDFDRQQLRAAVSRRTLCIIPDHLFGLPGNLDGTVSLAREVGAFVVEDVSQAMGGEDGARRLGTVGDVGFYSLGRGKNLTCGAGGIIVTNSDAIGAAIEQQFERLAVPSLVDGLMDLLKAILLVTFIRPSFYWFPAGLAFLRLGETVYYQDFPISRLSGVKAALLCNWQKRLTESNEARRRSADWFIGALSLRGHRREISYLRLPVIVPTSQLRDRLIALSQEEGLGLSAMYPRPINEIDEVREQFKGERYPVAADVARRVLTIPTHPYLEDGDRRRIAEIRPLLGLD